MYVTAEVGTVIVLVLDELSVTESAEAGLLRALCIPT